MYVVGDINGGELIRERLGHARVGLKRTHGCGLDLTQYVFS